MIRKIVVTSLLVVCALSAAAQRPRARIEWGVLGGINIPDYTTNMSGTDVKNKLGWQAGIVTAVNLGAFAIEPQILYVRQGLRIKPEGAKEINLKSNSIDVPVLVSLRLLRPFRFYAGPVFTVMNDCKQKSGGDLLDFGRVRPTMSYTVGAGVKLLGHLLMEQGYDVKVSEVHGMSQRGGSVVTYVRYGDKVASPIIDKGEADFIVSFELLEAARWLGFLKPDGQIVTSTQQIDPMPVITGAAQYPENLVEKMKAAGAKVDALDCLALAEEAGSSKAVNIVLMGRLSHYFDLPDEAWQKSLEVCVPSKFLELNKKAFQLGKNA